MASTELNVGVQVGAQVEFQVGEKTGAWLESLGWTPPSEEVQDSALVEAVAVYPSDGVQAARVAMYSRERERARAQELYMQLLKELDPPNDRLLALLEYFGVNMEKFLSPVRAVEIPGMASDASART